MLALLSGSAALPQSDTTLKSPVRCPGGEWELVFADDFDANTLNREHWITWFPDTDNGSDHCAFCRTHGDEGQIYKGENVVVSNGTLKLVARYEPANWFGERRNYTSGMIHSRQRFGIGRYEIRARLPGGMGFWPAIWTYGKSSAELDIMEAGMLHPRRFHMSVHNYKIKKMLHRRRGSLKDLSTGFHTFTMDWDTNMVRFAIDGYTVWRISPYQKRYGLRVRRCPIRPGKYRKEPIFPPFDETVSLMINLAIGNEQTPFTKSPDTKTLFPNQMEIEYIKVFRRR